VLPHADRPYRGHGGKRCAALNPSWTQASSFMLIFWHFAIALEAA